MIIRSRALRHGRHAFSAPLQRCCLRSITTEFLDHGENARRNIPDYNREASVITQLELSKKITKSNIKSPKKKLHPLQQDFAIKKQFREITANTGSMIGPHYEPNDLILDPPRPEDLTLEMLMASQAHMGHSTSVWNPANQRYIYGVRQGIHIISLETTAQYLRRAAKIVDEIAYRAGIIIFVGTRSGQQEAVCRAAELARGYHVFDRWLPGTITNKDNALQHCELKVVGAQDEDVWGYEDKMDEWPALKPDLIVVMNPLENYTLLHECGLHNVPTIGVIDTDADPTWVTYPIPANDDSIRCIEVIAGVLGRAGQAGVERRLEAARNGKLTWDPPEDLGEPYDGDENAKRVDKEQRASDAQSRGVHLKQRKARQRLERQKLLEDLEDD